MGTLAEFKKLSDAEDYFDFFDLDYDDSLVDVKRFHILRKFGEEVAKIDELELTSQERILDMYKFALVRVYKDFESGYEPSAAEVWKMFDKPNPCMACSTLEDCSNKEMDNARENDSCSTEVPFQFYKG